MTGSVRLEESKDPLTTRILDMEALLAEIREDLGDFVDVVDGNDEQPKPNWAMRLVSRIDEVLP